MKKNLYVLMVALTFIVGVSSVSAATSALAPAPASVPVSASALASTKQITLLVKGMVCSFCAQGIEKKLYSEPAVETVKVSLKDKTVVLTLKEGMNLSNEKIKQLLTDAGYTVDKIEKQ